MKQHFGLLISESETLSYELSAADIITFFKKGPLNPTSIPLTEAYVGH